MCCSNGGGRGNRTQEAQQRAIPETQRAIQAQSHRQTDSGNPVNRTAVPQTTRNVERANEVNRNSYHSRQFQ